MLKFALVLMVLPTSCTTTSHLSQKYPYGLLTSDYGILNEDDLGVYAWWAKPTPFEEGLSSGYMYWQCFPTSAIKLRCRKIGSDNSNIPYSDADIHIETDTEIHEYGFRRGVELEVCKTYLKHWRRLIEGEGAVCFGGNVSDIEEVKVKGKIKKSVGWVGDRVILTQNRNLASGIKNVIACYFTTKLMSFCDT